MNQKHGEKIARYLTVFTLFGLVSVSAYVLAYLLHGSFTTVLSGMTLALVLNVMVNDMIKEGDTITVVHKDDGFRIMPVVCPCEKCSRQEVCKVCGALYKGSHVCARLLNKKDV